MPLIEPQTGFDPIQLNGSLGGESQSVFFDDFEQSNAFGSFWTVLGAGSAALTATIQNNHPGVVNFGTGGGVNIGGIQAAMPAFALTNGYWLFNWLVNVPVLSGAEAFIARAGLGTSLGVGDAVDGVYFEYDASISANWRIKAAKASARVAADSGVVVTAGQWYSLQATGADATSPAVFSIDGVSVGSIAAASLPTANVTYAAHIQKTVGVVNREFWADFFTYQYAFSAFR